MLVSGVLAGWIVLLATPNSIARQAAATTVRQAGTVKSVSGNSITLTPDSGPDVTVVVQDSAKLVRVAPGQKDLKDAKPIQLSDIQCAVRTSNRTDSLLSGTRTGSDEGATWIGYDRNVAVGGREGYDGRV